MYGEVVRVMVLFYLLPLWGVLGGALFLGEPLTRFRLLGMSLALVGAFLVLGGPSLFQSPPSWIDAIAIGSGFFFAMNNLSFRASQDVPVGIKVGTMFVGCAICAGLLLVLGVQHFPSDVTSETWGYTMAFGVLVLLITAATQWGVTHMEAGRSSIIMILELLSAVASTALITKVWLAPSEAIGAVLIVVASLIETRGTTPGIH
jgi:drug/metabolite transporter (DMT)-like permease